jgi:hypothetical protein
MSSDEGRTSCLNSKGDRDAAVLLPHGRQFFLADSISWMSWRTAWTNGSTCGGAGVTPGDAASVVGAGFVGRSGCLDGDFGAAVAVGWGVFKAAEEGEAGVADSVAASGLSVGAGCDVAGGSTAADAVAVAEEALATAADAVAVAEEALATATDAGAEEAFTTATEAGVVEAFAVAISARDAGAGAVIRPARNPIPMSKTVSAARIAQGERRVRKGELVRKSGSSAATTGGDATMLRGCVENGTGTGGLSGRGLAAGSGAGSDGLAATLSTGSGSASSCSGSASASSCSGSGSAMGSADTDTVVIGVAIGVVVTGAFAVAAARNGTGVGGSFEACAPSAVGAGGSFEACVPNAVGAGGSFEACVRSAVGAGSALRAGDARGDGLADDDPAAGGLAVGGGRGGRAGGRLMVGFGCRFAGDCEGRIDIVKSLYRIRRARRVYLQVPRNQPAHLGMADALWSSENSCTRRALIATSSRSSPQAFCLSVCADTAERR